MHKPSDYAHAYGERPKSNWKAVSEEGRKPVEAPEPRKNELATFRLLYESDRICLFETRDGHVTAVSTDRLA